MILITLFCEFVAVGFVNKITRQSHAQINYMFRTVSVTLILMKLPPFVFHPPSSESNNNLFVYDFAAINGRCVYALCFVDHHLRYYALFTTEKSFVIKKISLLFKNKS